MKLLFEQLSEKTVELESVQLSLQHFETAYNQATEQYTRLQEHYQQAANGTASQPQVGSTKLKIELTIITNFSFISFGFSKYQKKILC